MDDDIIEFAKEISGVSLAEDVWDMVTGDDDDE